MISLLIWLLLLLIVVYVVHLVIDSLGLPENIRKIAYLIVALIVLLVVLSQLGILGGAGPPVLLR
jgi:hypothetical protein